MDLPLPQPTRYDQAARYLLAQARDLFFRWLLRRRADQLRFARWLPTVLTLPGVAQRLCDAVAELADLERNGLPFAALLEIQTVPDATMPGRLMLAGGLVWLTVKPTPLPGDRYELVGVIVNLTGQGDAARACVLGTAEWTLRPVELNLETLDAAAFLDEVAAGEAPPELLPFVPLMRYDDEDVIIKRWREIVDRETDPRLRTNAPLARVFAERAGRPAGWDKILEGFAMIESPLIAELLAGAEAKAEAKAEANAVVRVLARRFQAPPEDLVAAIRACADSAKLGQWLDLAVEAASLDDFRQKAGL